MSPIRKTRAFWLLCLGQAFAELAGRCVLFSVLWLALGWGASGPAWASAAALAQLVPSGLALAPLSRRWDRHPHRERAAVLGAGVALAGLATLLAWLIRQHQLVPPMLVAWCVPVGLCADVLAIGLKTAAARLFSGPALASAQSAQYAAARLARIAAPLLAAAVAAAGGLAPFGAAALFMAAASLLVARVPLPHRPRLPPAHPAPRPPRQPLPPDVHRAFLVRGAGNLLWPVYTVGLPLILRGRPEGLWLYGGLSALYGAGSVLGSLAAGRAGRSLWPRYGRYWAGIGAGFLLTGVGRLPVVALAVIGMAVLAPMAHVLLDGEIGRSPPEHHRQLFSAQQVVVNLTGASDYTVMPLAAGVASSGTLFPAAGLILMAIGLLASSRRPVTGAAVDGRN